MNFGSISALRLSRFVLIQGALLAGAVSLPGFTSAQVDGSATIRPVSVTVSVGSEVFPASQLIDASGLTAPPFSRHTGLAESNWTTEGPAPDYFAVQPPPVLIFDLGEDTALGGIAAWPYSFLAASGTEGAFQANSARDFRLRFASAAEGPAGFGASIGYEPQFVLPPPPASPPLPVLTARSDHHFDQVIYARYVEMTILDNYFGASDSLGGDRVGLGEVAFLGRVGTFGGKAYEMVPTPILQMEAYDEAMSRHYAGMPGYLTNITSQAENDFLATRFSDEADLAWIGASDALDQENWLWLSGPEASQVFWTGQQGGQPFEGRFNNWSPQEPNDLVFPTGREDYAQIVLRSESVFNAAPGEWLDSDVSGSPVQGGYLVEYEVSTAENFDNGGLWNSLAE